MTDEERVFECQREIRRLRGVVREQYEETIKLKKLIQCLARGIACAGLSADYHQHILVLGGAELDLHELLQEVIREELR